MMLRLQHNSIGVKQDRASTYMTAGTNDLLPFLLRKIPSIPPAHHSTPCGCQLLPPASQTPPELASLHTHHHGMLHILVRPRPAMMFRKRVDDALSRVSDALNHDGEPAFEPTQTVMTELSSIS
jgi:hypothetical protein